MNVRVHLLDEGVKVGIRGHQVPDGKVNLKDLLSELIEGIEKGSMKALAGWVKESDHVIAF